MCGQQGERRTEGHPTDRLANPTVKLFNGVCGRQRHRLQPGPEVLQESQHIPSLLAVMRQVVQEDRREECRIGPIEKQPGLRRDHPEVNNPIHLGVQNPGSHLQRSEVGL